MQKVVLIPTGVSQVIIFNYCEADLLKLHVCFLLTIHIYGGRELPIKKIGFLRNKFFIFYIFSF